MEPLTADATACAIGGAATPHVFVLFGATGDLAGRKVFPALCTLLAQKSLPQTFALVGVSRTELTDEAFRERLRASLAEHRPELLPQFEAMAANIFYAPVRDFADAPSFQALATRLEEVDGQVHAGGSRVFYLAVPPTAYEDIARSLGRAGLARETPGAWARLVVEKPFGHDLASARLLDAALHEHFAEHQIFRIDHYMAKETVQNVLMLRFANVLFEPVWNRNYIERVEITAAESLGVEHRAGYYDTAGVLRDMFQNHMMQLLALCAMEPPSRFEAERVRDEKSKVFRSLAPFPTDRIQEHLVLGQYGSGVVNGEKVKSYLFEDGVPPESLTPTYALMKVHIDNWRWQGVPFFIMSGKRLAQKRTEIVIHFKEVPHALFRKVLGHIATNRLTLGIYPREVIDMSLQSKAPGSRMCLRPVDLHFDYGTGGGASDGYETIILDVMLGDQTLFWRQDAVELCWGYLTPILLECDCPEKAERLYLYKSGSWGPQQAKTVYGEAAGHD